MHSIAYQPDSSSFANPERGFYLHTEARSRDYEPLDLEDLRSARAAAHVSLVYRGFVLEDFVASPISDAYLSAVERDMETLRAAGMKAVVRFAYTTQARQAADGDGSPMRPYGDADLARVLAHLDQLEPLLHRHADVIAVVQAGLIGIWGEWYYTDHFAGADLDELEPCHWEARRQVVERLLRALPGGRCVQLRTPRQKQVLVGSVRPLTAAQAFTDGLAARLGHHNDCFLADATDSGTYQDPDGEKAYLQVETRFVPMGGETCRNSPPRSDCATALAELARLHWSFLNAAYHPEVLARWRDGGCLQEVEQRLGYRLALVSARHQPRASRGGVWSVQLGLLNSGFAAPYLPRRVDLVLRHLASGGEFRAPLDVDLRRAWPDQALVVERRLGLPSQMPTGAYEACLHLADADPELASRPEYAIRLANTEVWEPRTGYNRLGMVVEVGERRSWWPRRPDAQLIETPAAPARFIFLDVPVDAMH